MHCTITAGNASSILSTTAGANSIILDFFKKKKEIHKENNISSQILQSIIRKKLSTIRYPRTDVYRTKCPWKPIIRQYFENVSIGNWFQCVQSHMEEEQKKELHRTTWIKHQVKKTSTVCLDCVWIEFKCNSGIYNVFSVQFDSTY